MSRVLQQINIGIVERDRLFVFRMIENKQEPSIILLAICYLYTLWHFQRWLDIRLL